MMPTKCFCHIGAIAISVVFLQIYVLNATLYIINTNLIFDQYDIKSFLFSRSITSRCVGSMTPFAIMNTTFTCFSCCRFNDSYAIF